MSCQKKKNKIVYKNRVINLLTNLDSININDDAKIKKLDTISLDVFSFNNDTITRDLIFKIANKYYFLNSPDEYLKLSKKALHLSTQERDSIHMAKALCYIGSYYNDFSRFDSAFYYFNKSEKIYKALNDTLMQGWTSIYKGGGYFDNGNFAECETETIKALRLVEKAKRNDLVFSCYNIIALSLKELQNYKKSLEYFDMALKQLDQLEKENYPIEDIQKYKLACYNNIGRVFEKQEKLIHEWTIEQVASASKPNFGKVFVTAPNLLRALGDIEGRDVLELGCGNGYWLRLLARAGAKTTGIDLAENQIAAARSWDDPTTGAIDYRVGDVSKELDLQGKFDIAFFEHVLLVIRTNCTGPYRTPQTH